MRYIIRLNDSKGTWYRRATSTGQGGWVKDKAEATRYYDAAQTYEYLAATDFIGPAGHYVELGVGEALAVIRVA